MRKMECAKWATKQPRNTETASHALLLTMLVLTSTGLCDAQSFEGKDSQLSGRVYKNSTCRRAPVSQKRFGKELTKKSLESFNSLNSPTDILGIRQQLFSDLLKSVIPVNGQFENGKIHIDLQSADIQEPIYNKPPKSNIGSACKPRSQGKSLKLSVAPGCN